MNIHEAEEELNKAQAKETRHRDDYQRRIEDIGHETRAKVGRPLASGRMRRQIRNDDSALLMLNNSALSQIAFTGLIGKSVSWEDIQSFWHTIQGHFATATRDKAFHVDARADEKYSYIYKTIGVSIAVREQLDREIAEVEEYEAERQALYNDGQYGPFGADYRIGRAMEEYAMRAHPVTGEKTFCEVRVADLQTKASPCNGPVCPVVVYSTVETSSLRGLHIKAADPNSPDAVKITTSDKAVEVAATPIRVQPQQYHFHLNG